MKRIIASISTIIALARFVEPERREEALAPVGMTLGARRAAAEHRSAEGRMLHDGVERELQSSPRRARKQAVGLLSATDRAVEIERHLRAG